MDQKQTLDLGSIGQPLANSRHEAFARNVATGMSLVDAYAKAGFIVNNRDSGMPARLANIDLVKARIIDLKNAMARNTVKTAYKVTLEGETRVLLAARNRCWNARDMAGFARFQLMLMKAHGLLKDAVDASGDVQGLSETQLVKTLPPEIMKALEKA